MPTYTDSDLDDMLGERPVQQKCRRCGKEFRYYSAPLAADAAREHAETHDRASG